MRTDEIENGEGVKELLAACGVTPVRGGGGNNKQVENLCYIKTNPSGRGVIQGVDMMAVVCKLYNLPGPGHVIRNYQQHPCPTSSLPDSPDTRTNKTVLIQPQQLETICIPRGP
eukprot:sb/3476891/